MAVTKLGLYNDALILLGQRVLSTDTEDRPNRHKLDALYDNGAVDYCLEIVKPKFAAKLSSLTGVTPTLTTAYTKEATLPSTFQGLVGVFADAAMDQPITRYTHEADKILSDVTPIYVRFVQDFATVALTNMTFTFGRVVSAYMARELSINVDPDETENCDTQLQARLELSLSQDTDSEFDPAGKGLSASALTDDWRKIYNDALQILGVPRIASNTDDSQRKNALDITRESEVVEAMLEDQAWQFSKESKKLDYDASIEPEFGPRYAFLKPIDIHRLNGIWADEYQGYPVREYIDEDGYFYTDYTEVYIEYVSTDYLTTPSQWKSYFKRYLAARMAVDAGPQIPGANIQAAVEQLKDRESMGKSVDAMSSPPKQFSSGSWARSRNGRHNTSDRNRP